MENAADALKMAASVLIFVLALTIAINSFSETRAAAATILTYKDRDYDYTYVQENKDADGNPTTERWVGVESVIPTIYKAYKENYKVVFADGILDNGVYKQEDESGTLQTINRIDLSEITLGGDTQKEQFLRAVIYGSNATDNNGNRIFDSVKTTVQKNLKIYLNSQGIYDKIKNIKLKENIGVYYSDEVGQDTSGSNVPEASKIEKRVITYTLQ